jgi:PKD repeat protein
MITGHEFTRKMVATAILLLFLVGGFATLVQASLPPEVKINGAAAMAHWEEPQMPAESGASSRDVVKTFNVDASFEWAATKGDFSTWETHFKSFNKKLYDGTDGQMALNRIDLYTNKKNWNSVDVHINSGTGRAYTYRGGIQWSNAMIEVYTNDNGKVLQHEWGHYGLFLPDEYTDSGGPHCTCTMGTTYNTDEWCTDSNHNYGHWHAESKSCYQQIKDHYPQITENEGNWVPGPYNAPTPEIIWHFPDLYMTDTDVSLSTYSFLPGEEVTIYANIYNFESLISKNVPVAFYDNTGSGFQLIQMENPLVSGFMSQAQTAWVATEGEHTLKVIIDPDDTIEERYENNNTGLLQISVPYYPDISSSLNEFSSDEDTALVVDLTPYESDIEDTGEDLDWTVTAYDSKVITKISGENSNDDVLTFEVEDDWNGETEVELTLTDSDGLTASKIVKLIWDSVNDAPVVTNMFLDKCQIYRTETVTISVEGEDIEDAIETLSATIEYKHHDESSYVIATSGLMGSTFTATVPFLESSTPGFYDFKATLSDSEGGTGNPHYMNMSLEVQNNLPVIEAVTFSEDEVYRTGTHVIYIDAYDVETAEAYLQPTVQFALSGEEFWENVEGEMEYVEDHWEVEWIPDAELETGSYMFQILVTDLDEGISNWYWSDEIAIMNNIPVVTDIKVSGASLLRGESINVWVYGTDVEDDAGELEIELHYKGQTTDWEAAFIQGLDYSESDKAWTAKFVPSTKAKVDTYTFSARLTDTDGGKNEFFEDEDTVKVENNNPTAKIESLRPGTAGQKVKFDGSKSTDLEDKGLTYVWDFGDGKTGNGATPAHTYANARTYTVKLTVKDSDGGEDVTTTTLKINEAPIFGGGGGGSTGLSAAALGGIAALIIVMIIVIVLLVAWKTGKIGKKEEQPPPLPPAQEPPRVAEPVDPLFEQEAYKAYDPPKVDDTPTYGQEESEQYLK